MSANSLPNGDLEIAIPDQQSTDYQSPDLVIPAGWEWRLKSVVWQFKGDGTGSYRDIRLILQATDDTVGNRGRYFVPVIFSAPPGAYLDISLAIDGPEYRPADFSRLAPVAARLPDLWRPAGFKWVTLTGRASGGKADTFKEFFAYVERRPVA